MDCEVLQIEGLGEQEVVVEVDFGSLERMRVVTSAGRVVEVGVEVGGGSVGLAMVKLELELELDLDLELELDLELDLEGDLEGEEVEVEEEEEEGEADDFSITSSLTGSVGVMTQTLSTPNVLGEANEISMIVLEEGGEDGGEGHLLAEVEEEEEEEREEESEEESEEEEEINNNNNTTIVDTSGREEEGEVEEEGVGNKTITWDEKVGEKSEGATSGVGFPAGAQKMKELERKNASLELQLLEVRKEMATMAGVMGSLLEIVRSGGGGGIAK